MIILWNHLYDQFAYKLWPDPWDQLEDRLETPLATGLEGRLAKCLSDNYE
jgi:hypothetical protein